MNTWQPALRLPGVRRSPGINASSGGIGRAGWAESPDHCREPGSDPHTVNHIVYLEPRSRIDGFALLLTFGEVFAIHAIALLRIVDRLPVSSHLSTFALI
ncbi:hypothetical protein I1A62_33685 [Rhodococcus sp. USK10]|uniref:hypothetical protein n=1 Tax=Rhodococcus sp. USK10 TaxID=2789739 RepID=UPI001C60530A|nr:hypothetical protein [Rhodococcus sp. USK10]QYB02142.1 hypothetical protein I1A62_33685 [Rhodococcus sp. USK10]